MGVYKPASYILEVKNNAGETPIKFKDESKKVIDPQVAYIISDILNDANARRPLFGNITKGFSFNNGLRTSTKTGTSDRDGKPKDLWMMSYSPAIAMGVWLGNSDTSPLKGGNSTLPGYIVDKVMGYAHQEIYAKEGKWKANDWFTQPAGIQVMNQNGTKELYPSWYNKTSGQSNAKLTFDKVSKKKAIDCTPESAKIEIDVLKSIDPVTKKEVFVAPDGYDGSKTDDIHKCEDSKPSVNNISINKISGNTYKIIVSVTQGTHSLSTLAIKVNGTTIGSVGATTSGDYSTTYAFTTSGPQSINAAITDTALYSGESTKEVTTSSFP